MTPERRTNRQFLLLWAAGCIAALPVFVMLGDSAYPLPAKVLAWLLLVIGTLPMQIYLMGDRPGVPVIELVILAYVGAYALPVFFERELTLYVTTIFPDTVPVTACIALAIVAVCALWAGYKVAPYVFRRLPLPKIRLHCVPERLFYYAAALAVVSLSRSERFGVFEQVVQVFVAQDLAIALLALLYYKGHLNPVMKAATLILLLAFILKGVSTGMTQLMLQPIMIWLICRWLVLKKFELSIIAVGILAFVLIQPVKLQYREIVWVSNEPFSQIEKLGIFADLFSKHWLSGRALREGVTQSTTNRTSLLLQTAHVIDWTPEVVPYEDGRTFLYFLVGWVPRFMWPDKPVAQEANIKYAVHYGVTTEEGIQRTMFGVGELGEAFMNFGTIGILPVFLILGMLSYLPVHLISLPSFYRLQVEQIHTQDVAPLALLVAIIVKLIFISSTVANVYGGILQLILIQGTLIYLMAGDHGRANVLGQSQRARNPRR